MTSDSSSRRVRWVVAAVLAALTCAVLYTLRGSQQIHDSMSYAVSIKTGWRLFHPHHLLFGPIVRVLWLPIAGFVDAIGAAQIHNAAWAVAAVLSAGAIVRRTTGSLPLGAASSALLLATYGMLFFAVQVEVYVAAAGAFALAILVLGEEHTPGRLAAAALLLALSIFYHQPNVLLCLPLLVFFWSRSGSVGLRRALVVIGAAGVLVLGTYVAVFLVEGGRPGVTEFIEFTLRYAVGEDEHAREWGASENVGLQGARELLTAQLSTWVVLPDESVGTGIRVLGGASVLLFAWTLVAILRGRDERGARRLLLGWWLVNDLFYLWWQPGQREFFVAPLVPMAALSGMALADVLRAPSLRRASAGALALATGVLLVFNVRHIEARMVPTMRAAAGEYLELVPRDAFHLSFRNSIQELRYSFDVPLDRSGNLTLAKRRLLTGIGTDTLEPLPRTGSVVLPGSEALPNRRVSAERTAGWMRYLTWLFRLQFGPDGPRGVLRGPAVSLVTDPGGPFYLVQGPADVSYPDLLAFLRALDLTLESAGRRPAFQPWFAKHRAAILGP